MSVNGAVDLSQFNLSGKGGGNAGALKSKISKPEMPRAINERKMLMLAGVCFFITTVLFYIFFTNLTPPPPDILTLPALPERDGFRQINIK